MPGKVSCRIINDPQACSSVSTGKASGIACERKVHLRSSQICVNISSKKNTSVPLLVADRSEATGSTNLMSHYGLEHSYNKFSGKKFKEELSAFMPNLPGNIDTPGMQDNR